MKRPGSTSWLGALAAALLLMASGCSEPRSCTRIGCGGSRLTLDTDGWMPGEYEIELRYTLGGDHAFVCTFSVEDPQNAGGDAGADPIQSTCTQTVGTGRAVHLYPIPGMEPALAVHDTPDEVRFVLRSGGQMLFDDTIKLEYVESSPNGPGCGACRSGSMTLSLL